MGVAQTMNTQTTNTAQDYCRSIQCELDALENLLDCETVRTDDDDTRLAKAYAELEFENTGDTSEAIYQWINETLLDFKILRTDDRNQTRIEMLRTCGGPHCEITRDSNDGQVIAITTYDGTQQATIRNQYPNLSAYLDEIAQ